MTDEDWKQIRVFLKSWSAPQYDEETDMAYRIMLDDVDPVQLAMAIKYIGKRDAGRFRPSAHELVEAATGLTERPAPPWTRAERMAAKAVIKATPEKGEEYLKSRPGGEYVLAWLKEYGWRRFATEPQDSYTYTNQRKSYEEHVRHSIDDRAARTAIGASIPRPKEVGPARRLDPSQALPRGAHDDVTAPAVRQQQQDPFDF